MPVVLGKRKRTSPAETQADASLSFDRSSGRHGSDLQDVFRRAFEKQFRPLDVPIKAADVALDGTDEDNAGSESDFKGFDLEDELSDEVEVVEHTSGSKLDGQLQQEMRAFMRPKPPIPDPTANQKTQLKGVEGAEEKDDKINIKNDLALHRLINESHLLDGSKREPSNRRQQVLDSRLLSLGSKQSLLKQEKMPMSHRKGIAAKATHREERRRREARENGVVLEKPQRPKKAAGEHRVRGVGGPAVGKFRGGMLSLSKRDIADIQDSGQSRFKGKKR